MRAFIDTSSLVKRYILEANSEQLDLLLEGITEIIVSPVYLLEIHSALERRLQENSAIPQQIARIRREVERDYFYFGKVIWNAALEQKGIELIQKYHLRTLDSIQLASGIVARSDIFVTSDRKLFDIAQKELKDVHFI